MLPDSWLLRLPRVPLRVRRRPVLRQLLLRLSAGRPATRGPGGRVHRAAPVRAGVARPDHLKALPSMAAVARSSVLCCPTCGHAEPLAMPTDACVFFHACAACGVLLRPKPGDCCVFCSYGSVPCPPVQTGSPQCCGGSP